MTDSARFAWERLALNIGGAFLLPISNALIANTNLLVAAKLGLGYALAVAVGFSQNPNKPLSLPAQVEVGGQSVSTTAQVRVGDNQTSPTATQESENK